MLTDEVYTYTPLSRHDNLLTVRILELQPAKSPEAPLIGLLAEYMLPSSTEPGFFEALSYTWGDSSLSQQIRVGDKVLRIKPNLFEALQRLRLPCRQRRLWIDALCIDQTNDNEKTWQVSLMGQIYAKAEHVVAWLGNGVTSEDRGIFELLQLASPHRVTHPWSVGMVRKMPPLSRMLQYLQDLQVHSSSSQTTSGPRNIISDLERFLARSWFSRRWIVQECCNAREITMLFGSHELSWNDFSGAFEVLTGAAAAEGDHHLEQYPALALIVRRRGIIARSVIDSMEVLQHFQGQDDRDRIAAFLGLQWPRTSDGADFQVNYGESVTMNYHMFARYMVEIGYGAQILIAASNCHRVGDRAQSDLPSWVPDWRNFAPYIKSQETGKFDVRVIGKDRLEFSGRVCCTCLADVHANLLAANEDFIPSVEIVTQPAAPQREDISCKILTVDGNLSLYTFVLHKFDDSEKYRLIACKQERACDDIRCFEEWQQQTFVIV